MKPHNSSRSSQGVLDTEHTNYKVAMWLHCHFIKKSDVTESIINYACSTVLISELNLHGDLSCVKPYTLYNRPSLLKKYRENNFLLNTKIFKIKIFFRNMLISVFKGNVNVNVLFVLLCLLHQYQNTRLGLKPLCMTKTNYFGLILLSHLIFISY